MPKPTFRLVDLEQFEVFRRNKNLSIRRISDAVGISRTAFRRYKSGGGMTMQTAERLQQLGMPSEVLAVAL